jgi:hypothetical protein
VTRTSTASRLPAVDAAYDAEPWSDFAAGMAGAAAALAGLVFVAVSINIQTILAMPGVPERAVKALVMLSSPVFLGLAVLIPGQPDAALGVELLVVSAVLGPALVHLGRPAMRAVGRSGRSWVVSNTIPALVVAVAPVVAAIGLLTASLGGLYWIPAAVAFGLLGGLLNAWVLLVEILR